MLEEDLSAIAHALSDPTRLTILRLIVKGRTEACCSPEADCCPKGVCACDLEAALGILQSKISYHLRELKHAGVVREARRGRWNYYTVDMARIEAFSAMLGQFFAASASIKPLS